MKINASISVLVFRATCEIIFLVLYINFVSYYVTFVAILFISIYLYVPIDSYGNYSPPSELKPHVPGRVT